MATENSSLDNIPPRKGKAKRSHKIDDQLSLFWSNTQTIKKSKILVSSKSPDNSSKLLASCSQSLSSYPQPAQDQIELPEPEYRNVPVNVRRRKTGITPDEPPPSNSSTPRASVFSRNNKPSQRQRTRKGLDGNDGSGSDSDDGHGRRLDGDDSSAARPKKKKVPVTDNDMGGPSSLYAADLEESERRRQVIYQKQRISSMDEPRINSNGTLRKPRRASVKSYLRKGLLKEKDVFSEADNPELYKTTKHQNRLLQQYCDYALYSDIIDMLESEHEKKDTPDVALEKVALQVEREVIRTYLVFDIRTGIRLQLSPQDRLYVITDNIMKYLKESSDGNTEIDDHFIESFTSKYTGRRGEDEELDEELGPIVKDVAFKITKSAAESARIGGVPSIITQFKNSREGNRLNPDYIQFLLGDSYSHIAKTQSEVYEDHRAEIVREYRASLKSTNANLRQNIVVLKYPDSISLVLFKGKKPYTERIMSEEDFENFGWQTDNPEDPKPKYWRYKIVRDKVRKAYLDEDWLGEISIK